MAQTAHLLPRSAAVVALGVFCLTLLRMFRDRSQLRDEERNLRKRLPNDHAPSA
jgi:hypothetical protein